MTTPFVYTPVFYQPTPYLDPYTVQTHTPFIPPTANLAPSAPNTPPRRVVHFEDDCPAVPRPRVVSWHAGMPTPPTSVPFIITAPPQPVPIYGHGRRHSFGNANFTHPWAYNANVSPWVWPSQPLPQALIHPLLNGESPPPILFDLSVSTFSPHKFISVGQTIALSRDDLAQPATHPPTTHMRITCDAIPQWPIDLQFPSTPSIPTNSLLLQVPVHPQAITPITLGDVLTAIHRSLQTQITHLDWAKLNMSQEMEISRAYRRRCKTFPSVEQFEASQGVRRVDYLGKKVCFRGLVRERGTDGFENLKLIVGERPTNAT
ncbi:hypothetical protein JAAARDRAFT_38441 [Jaapia argillacea MUCL 33604]|uniref:DUF6699 domain-containing protein n=1 Tax=Jaapia argillacea MUCL 33604 TaxID=933084 RepID=A0A067PVC3_9AGAM|nr:hypothetical protein JAAARDRAFT_38441 [Jaapia argillacea MUCL 33604]